MFHCILPLLSRFLFAPVSSQNHFA
jgi:hypothetical protein